jgi:hypothetical protein
MSLIACWFLIAVADGGTVNLITAPTASVSVSTTMNFGGSGLGNDQLIALDSLHAGTTSTIWPPNLLPAGYHQGAPISNSADTGSRSYGAGQLPSDLTDLISSSYQGSISTGISFGPGGMAISVSGITNLAASNTMDATKAILLQYQSGYGQPNNLQQTISPGTEWYSWHQVQADSITVFSVTGSPTTISLTLVDKALSLANAGDLTGDTYAGITNNIQINPIHSLADFVLPNPVVDPNLDITKFWTPNMGYDPALNLPSYIFFEGANYATRRDQSGNTVVVANNSQASSQHVSGGRLTGRGNYSNYQSDQVISDTVTLQPGYVYMMDTSLTAQVVFGTQYNRSSSSYQYGGGTYLDPRSDLETNAQPADPASAAVPEPSSFLIFIGFAAIGGLGRSGRRLLQSALQ